METLANLNAFVRSAEAGTFSAAARQLGLTPAAVSRNVAQLEANLGVRLFQRSTRQLTLTEAGERFLQNVGAGLHSVQAAIDDLASNAGAPAGVLRVSAAPTFGLAYLLPLMPAFLARYPAVVPEWQLDNRQVDLIADGFDAAVGGGIELSPGVVARPLAPAHLVLVAAPTFLATHPPIERPEQLREVPGLGMRSPQTGRVRQWTLQDRNGQQHGLEVNAQMLFNDPQGLCQAALLGMGVALLAMPDVLAHLQSGALQRVLPGWYADAGPISLYYASQKLLPAKTRIFIDMLVEQAREQRWMERFDARP
ncbi:LysR substrate-binding domain-containing protein [Pseudomonas sp. NPDC089554]|uniref:LysR family transcriptional regulator n=1 Tax=Pseudomonas sp. NPDC089554 TaxID=3390653 RepID=UPI003CFEFC2E